MCGVDWCYDLDVEVVCVVIFQVVFDFCDDLCIVCVCWIELEYGWGVGCVGVVDCEFDLVLYWCVFCLVYVLDVVCFDCVFEQYVVGFVGDVYDVVCWDLECFVV